MTDAAASGTAPTRDFSALTTPVSKAEVSEFRRRSKAAGRFGGSSSASVLALIVGIFVLVMFFVVGSIVITVFMSVARATDGPPFTMAFIVIVFVGVLAVFVSGLLRRRGSGVWTQRLRLSRFADANGMGFSSGERNPAYPGAIFGVGGSRTVGNHLFSTAGRTLDVGSYSYQTGSGDDRTTHRWGFVALQLDRALPHMVLDARGNNGFFGGSNLPSGYRRNQVLSLEGDFDRYFTLYCPQEYERDALYVFTPDLMALLIDNASTFDVEIVDQWLFVYSAAPFELTDAVVLSRLFRIVDTVGAKTLSRTERYSDDRVGSRAEAGFLPGSTSVTGTGAVAPAGRRLRKRWGVTGIVVVAVFIGFQVLRFWLETR